MDSKTDVQKIKQRKKWPFWVGGTILALILIGGTTLTIMYDKMQKTVKSMHAPLTRDEHPEYQGEIEKILNENKTVNILLLGVDERPHDKGRSDTMILLSLNPLTESMQMLSIPRDTYVNIPGKGMDKINHAYAFGDISLSVATVEEAFDLPVHFYSKVNMEGFEQGIDAIGGITVNNEQAFTQDHSNFPVGKIDLNGPEALDFIRMRKQDPRGDLGRNERQRIVIAAALDKVVSFSSLGKIGDIFNLLQSHVKTNMDLKTMQLLFSNYRQAGKQIKPIELNGTGEYIGGLWYYVVSEDEFERIHNEVQQHMKAK